MKGLTVMAMGLAALAAAGSARAADLCKTRTLFDSHCALCHQFSMAGRQPGNFRNESPDINTLSEGDLQFLDNAGGSVPPLIGAKFFDKMKRERKSAADFSAYVSSAANSFPPTGTKEPMPYAYFKIAAYVLYRNCGKL
jgi:mono/diheme cytochrome c family protein